MEENKKTLLSGVKPTGKLHIGNYFGAMRQFLEMQEEYNSYFMVADYHALTTLSDPAKMRELSMGVTLDYLAIGLDPEKATIFKQSDVSEHTELAWIFNCVTTMPYLSRAHAYKDAQVKNKEVSVGTFAYPMLMAADILLYDTDIVPVGADQKQHVEYARDTAEKFNRTFKKIFKVPEEKILDDVAIVPGVDGQKMSKSYDNTISLFAEDEEIRKAIASIVTDSKDVDEPKDPEKCNIFALHKIFSEKELPEIKERYEKGDMGYRESKEILYNNLVKFITPLRERRKKLEENISYVEDVLENGAEKARRKAQAKMKEVRKNIGVR